MLSSFSCLLLAFPSCPLVPSHTRVQLLPCEFPPLNTLPSSQGLYFNGSAFLSYLSAAIVDASSVSPEKESHNFNSWAASSVSQSSQAPPTVLLKLSPPGLFGEEGGVKVRCRGKGPLALSDK